MADVKGVNQTKIDAGGIDNKIEQGSVDGRLKVYHDSYTTLGTEAAGSTIKLFGSLPKNLKVVGCVLAFDALGANVTLAAGDSNDADRYITAAAAASAGSLSTMRFTGLGYKLGTVAGDRQILITTAGATLAAAKVINAVLLVSKD